MISKFWGVSFRGLKASNFEVMGFKIFATYPSFEDLGFQGLSTEMV